MVDKGDNRITDQGAIGTNGHYNYTVTAAAGVGDEGGRQTCALSCATPKSVVSPLPAPRPAHFPSLYPPSPNSKSSKDQLRHQPCNVGYNILLSLVDASQRRCLLHLSLPCSGFSRALLRIPTYLANVCHGILPSVPVPHDRFLLSLHDSMPCISIPGCCDPVVSSPNISRDSRQGTFSSCGWSSVSPATSANCPDINRLGITGLPSIRTGNPVKRRDRLRIDFSTLSHLVADYPYYRKLYGCCTTYYMVFLEARRLMRYCGVPGSK